MDDEDGSKKVGNSHCQSQQNVRKEHVAEGPTGPVNLELMRPEIPSVTHQISRMPGKLRLNFAIPSQGMAISGARMAGFPGEQK